MTRATYTEESAPRTPGDAVVVLGASGGIGNGIVRELLAAGHTVVAVGRNQERLAALARGKTPRKLVLLQGSVGTDADAAELVRGVNGLSLRPAAVIASISGAMQSGRLLEKPASFLQNTLADDVVTHFTAAKHFLPLLAESRPGGLYLLISGPAGQCAWAGYGHRSVASAALRMLTLVLREEAKDLHLRVQQLQVGRPVRTERNADCACPDWLGAEDVGRRVVELIEAGSNEPVIQLGGYAKSPAPLDRAISA